MRNNSVYQGYFPYTEQCPVDGKKCVRDKACKMWSCGFESGSCWYVDFNNMIFEIFDSDDSHFIYFKDKNDRIVEAIRHLSVYLDFNEKLDSRPIELEIRVGFNSHRLADKIRTRFNLSDWQFESTNFEGGDDADLKLRIPAGRENYNQLKRCLLQIKDKLIPDIIEVEVSLNTCAICKEKSWVLNEYGTKAICAQCENRIILENIEKYC